MKSFTWQRVALIAALWTSAVAPAQTQQAAPKPDAAASQVSAQGQRIYEATRDQLLQVRTLLKEQDSQASVGSAFIVDGSGLAITNYHVVSQYALRPERYRLAFTMAQGRSGSAELLAIDVIHDLALVKLKARTASAPIDVAPLAFRPSGAPLSKGERIYSLGNPLDVGFAVAEGTYNGVVRRGFYPQIFFGGALSAGMSGGPALDQ
jgi:S1-C subfamily serine protease